MCVLLFHGKEHIRTVSVWPQ